MIRCFVLLLYASESFTFGYDSGGADQAACGRPYRSGRVYQPPCDLERQGYCTSAGTRYPWHAVKRFVRDNKGLMRRMYGDQRHGHVLRAELEEEMDIYDPLYDWHPPSPRSRFSRYQRYEDDDIDNELIPNEDNDDDDDDDDETFMEEGRYLRDDVPNVDLLNTRFVYSEDPVLQIKLAGLKTAAHFRPTATTTHRTTTVNPKVTTSKAAGTTTLKQIKTTILKPLKTTTASTVEEDSTTPAQSTITISSSTATSPTSNPTTVTTSNITTTTFVTSTPITTTTSPASTSPTTTILNSEDSTTETTTEESTAPPKKQTTTTTQKQMTTTTEKTTTIKQSAIDTSPLNLHVASDRLGEEDGASDDLSGGNKLGDGNEVSELSGGGGLDGVIEKVETMLFQDMVEEDSSKKKIHVHPKLRGVNACPVKEEVVAPFWANNTRGEVLALLNMYPFEQYVHWEKCTFEHRQMYCREGCRCEQQYRLHRLLAYDPSNECRGIFSDWFKFPSCCVCKCYDVPAEFRVTSRSPRSQQNFPET